LCVQADSCKKDYDVCVLTGDHRAQAFGPYEAALRGKSQLCAKQPIYGVLGNHDTVRMLLVLEQMGIPSNAFSILLSQTLEIYQQAAHVDFNVSLSGHTHGGQICLPGGIPITLDSVLPRYMGSGPWMYRDMNGYSFVAVGCSIVPARFNCPPEITLHFVQSPT